MRKRTIITLAGTLLTVAYKLGRQQGMFKSFPEWTIWALVVSSVALCSYWLLSNPWINKRLHWLSAYPAASVLVIMGVGAALGAAGTAFMMAPKPTMTGVDLKQEVLSLANDIREWLEYENRESPSGRIPPKTSQRLIEEQMARHSEYWERAMREFDRKFGPRVISMRNKLQRRGISTEEIDNTMQFGPYISGGAVLSLIYHLRVTADRVPEDLACP